MEVQSRRTNGYRPTSEYISLRQWPWRTVQLLFAALADCYVNECCITSESYNSALRICRFDVHTDWCLHLSYVYERELERISEPQRLEKKLRNGKGLRVSFRLKPPDLLNILGIPTKTWGSSSRLESASLLL